MKNYFAFLVFGFVLALAGPAHAGCKYDLAYKKLSELATFSGAPATGDLVPICDTSANQLKSMDFSTPSFGLTSFTAAPSADHATTKYGAKVNYTVPVHTTGTNTDNGFEVSGTISNATGGTNVFSGYKFDNVTGDASVDVIGVNVGTGTRLGNSYGMAVSTGWDIGLAVTNTAAADSAATEVGVNIALTTPVDTTGTNGHVGLNIDTTIGNATGGTNTATAINIANVTGDAQVTETAIKVGTGFDSGLTVNSPATFNGDVTGDGGDQLVGFLNDQVAATATTITAAQCGSTFISAGAIEMELPEASTVLGCRLTFVVNNASNFTIDPDAADIIEIATNAAGDSLIADLPGESIVLQAISATQWAVIGTPYGTWTDSN